MTTPEDLRESVWARYAAATASCCGQDADELTHDADGVAVFGAALYESDEHDEQGAVAASLGCGVPTAVADPHPGESVLDLARTDAEAAGLSDVELVHGYLEDIPLPDASIDVAISSCVLDLAADKTVVLAEVARVLRPGGRPAFSDVITDEDMDQATKDDTGAWTGCTTGALTHREMADALEAAGFTDVEIHPTHRVHTHAAAAIVRARR